MKKLILLGSILAIFAACKVEASNFYQWTNKDGSVSATDNPARIPASYQKVAVQRSFDDLEKSAHQSYVVTPNKGRLPLKADQIRVRITDKEPQKTVKAASA